MLCIASVDPKLRAEADDMAAALELLGVTAEETTETVEDAENDEMA